MLELTLLHVPYLTHFYTSYNLALAALTIALTDDITTPKTAY